MSYPGYPTPAVPAPKRSRLPWILGGVAVALVLCCTAQVTAGYLWAKRNDNDGASKTSPPSASGSHRPSSSPGATGPENISGKTYKLSADLCTAADLSAFADIAPVPARAAPTPRRDVRSSFSTASCSKKSVQDSAGDLIIGVDAEQTIVETGRSPEILYQGELAKYSGMLKASTSPTKLDGPVAGLGTQAHDYFELDPSSLRNAVYTVVVTDGNMVLTLHFFATKRPGGWTKDDAAKRARVITLHLMSKLQT